MKNKHNVEKQKIHRGENLGKKSLKFSERRYFICETRIRCHFLKVYLVNNTNIILGS